MVKFPVLVLAPLLSETKRERESKEMMNILPLAVL